MSRPSQIVSSVAVPKPQLRALYARGAVVQLSNGREYLDLMNGKGCITLGHHHPSVTEAMITRLREKVGCLTCWSDSFEILAAMIVADSGISGAQVAFFSTGTEACRAAVECSRRFSGKNLIASAGYHGWGDFWAPSSVFLEPNKNGVVDFYFVPELLEEVLDRYRGQIAMVMVSPDYVHLRPETLKRLVKLSKESEVLYCSDDVKNGYRYVAGSALPITTGEHADLYTFSKGLSNGQRLSCLVGTPEVMRTAKHMTYTSYFDSLPIAAALATLNHMSSERGYERLTACGSTLSARLRRLIEQSSVPIKVVGDGPLVQMIGATETLDEAFYSACANHGLLLYDYDNQAVSLATEDVLSAVTDRFKLVFEDLAGSCGPLNGTEVSTQRQMEAAFSMIDGATDAVPAGEAIRWLREHKN